MRGFSRCSHTTFLPLDCLLLMNPALLLIGLFFIIPAMGPLTVFDFSAESDLSSWRIVDDVVMGGRSDSNLQINDAGHGWFHGHVSLDNYGGFASARYKLDPIKVRGARQVKNQG